MIYLMLDDEPLDRRSIVFVNSEEKAKILVKYGRYDFYQEISLLSDDDVKDAICEDILNKIDNWEEFHNIHCKECTVPYNEVCPFKEVKDD